MIARYYDSRPTVLGRMLDYCARSYRYALPRESIKRALTFTPIDNIALTNRYEQASTVTFAEAMKLAVTSAWVYSGIKMIADRVAAADARPSMKRRVGDELRDQPNHPFALLLDMPNSMMTWEFVSRYLTWWCFLSGNAYLFISTPEIASGTPEELWPLPSDSIEPDPKSRHISLLTGKPCVNYTYTVNGKKTVLPGENIVHIRLPNPFDYWVGLAPLSAFIESVKTDRYQAKYLQGFFGKDNAVPTSIISLPAETNENDFETAKEMIRTQFGEGRRSAIIRAGDFTVQTITQTLREMELNTARKFNREEINHVLGIPEGLINGSTSGDSRLATEITFARITIQPFIDLVAAEMTANLAPFYGAGFVVKAPSVIPQDRALALQEYEKYSQDRSINENRLVLHLPPMDMPGLVTMINTIRAKTGLEPIDTPLDSVLMDLMLNIPTRLIPVLSSNTFANASATGLRVGQKDASGKTIEDPFETQLGQMKQLQDMQQPPPDVQAGDTGTGDTGQAGGSGGGQAPAFANTKQPPKTPSLIGAPGGAREVQVNGGKSWMSAAVRMGQQTELNRWKKVAIKQIKDKSDPGGYVFETSVLPESLTKAIQQQLAGANETKCQLVFDTWLATLSEIEVVA